MVTITATTYFSNNIMVRCQLTLGRALALVDHARAIIPADAGLLEVHSPSRVMLVPDHIIFNVDKAFVPHSPLPNKRGVYQRDGGACAYCGKPISLAEATLDHVIPQRLGGEDAWDNLVTCCTRCNQKKGGRTPEQARMKLGVQPRSPKVRLRPE